MKRYSEKELKILNQQFKGITPAEIVQWVVSNAARPVVTTNFRPYEAAILHAVSDIDPVMKVIWCDTGYNTPQTYRHAKQVIDQLKLNVKLYTPKETAAYRDALFGGIPDINNPQHEEFTRQVKLEPFLRAMEQQNPDVWFTNLRKGQTSFRNSIDILSYSKDGILKVSPFYHWSDEKLDAYLEENALPNEFKYFDPTKVLENRECGLHA
ncbi:MULTISPECIES: phosphoadenosine phosphosulfate reductase domain-containing protein [Salegentibacter]|jgi:phosphoadenosine phosphosulfate reductase|uniref:Phosphoadenylylsulfate reductase n=2 Tax=Salegentibacter TaxID=143222 RepID=A0A0Q9ZKU4_9FLAO|nr:MULTISPECIES: phosphoadenosine phosphosulfate reductase family protein [Salegentibacter]KRG30706.1 phosphoadenylylsulfate reductase [Salegentibacter mishustinae]MDX1426185.1 phosphoadenosine phosphosulfate reductase family protein [Salegentibacter mishustinae]OEY71815.1 phosphoadenylylsulfate reductase [Salegentibacter salarius]PKD17408.1 phosphoadenylylsulfate reductase [Salegentibacter salarius]PNW23595.1 phosphoadenylylsulfate reductase [Salegentibacter mishustinae]